MLEREKQARTVNVEVECIDPEAVKGFLVGYSSDVEIIIEVEHDVLGIPTESLLDNNKVYVYQPQSRILEERTVQIGLSNWDNTQVVDELQEGDFVVTSTDRPGLEDGIRVIISEE